jgi:hypothetical protein
MALQYFNGQGKIYLGTRDADGNAQAMLWVGNAPTFKFGLEEVVTEHKESYSGNRLTDVRLTTELKSTVEMTLEQLDTNNLNILLFGTSVSQGAGSVSAYALEGSATPTVGHVYLFADQDVSSVVITDSTGGTPKTLTSGTNYELDADAGMITMLDITTGGAFTGPLNAAYTRAAVTRTKLFGSSAVEYWVRFVGLNTAVSGSPKVIVDLYRARLSPAQEVGLITDDIAQFVLQGSVLADQTKTLAGDFGQFGRMIRFES